MLSCDCADTPIVSFLQGNVFTFLQQSGGRLPEGVVVPMILEPTMSALNYIHELVSCGRCVNDAVCTRCLQLHIQAHIWTV
jgi:hypothetical protein